MRKEYTSKERGGKDKQVLYPLGRPEEVYEILKWDFHLAYHSTVYRGYCNESSVRIRYINTMKGMGKRPFFKIAHRGASAYEPENTLLSFRRAIEMGAHMIELDVRLSLDGYLVVIHDKRVDRTTDGTGPVRRMTLSDLKKLDAGKGERIPTLEEVIDMGKGKTRFVVELKEEGLEEKTVSLIRENDLFQDAFIVSYHRNLVRRVKELEPRAITGLISLFSLDTVGNGRESLVKIVAPFHYFITRRMVERVHESGMLLFTWTVDSRERAERLREMGVDGIVTNRPDIV